MKVLLLGVSGMLGKAIYRHLKKRDIFCVAPFRSICDITSFAQLEKQMMNHEFTHIINCSGYTNVEKAEEEKELAYQINAIGVQNLGRISQLTGCKIVHFSTDYVFNGQKDEPYLEKDTPDPINVYGKTKLEGEIFLQNKSDNVLIIRISWLFGLEGNHFISKVISCMQKKRELFVVSDQVGRPTFCEDLAQIVIEMCSFSGVFHFANSGAVSWYEYACFIYEQISIPFCQKITPVSSEHFIMKAKRPKHSVLSTEKLENTLKIFPRSWKDPALHYMGEIFAQK